VIRQRKMSTLQGEHRKVSRVGNPSQGGGAGGKGRGHLDTHRKSTDFNPKIKSGKRSNMRMDITQVLPHDLSTGKAVSLLPWLDHQDAQPRPAHTTRGLHQLCKAQAPTVPAPNVSSNPYYPGRAYNKQLGSPIQWCH
jgi:hypothetical protein